MKTTYISLGVVALASVLGYLLYSNNQKVALAKACPADVMVCSDGTSIPRSGPECQFSICKDSTTSDVRNNVPTNTETISTSTLDQEPTYTNIPITPPTKSNGSIISKFTTAISSKIAQGTSFIQSNVASGLNNLKSSQSATTESTQTNTQNTAQPANNQNQTPPDETRFEVNNGSIVNQDNTVIYTIPASVSTDSTSTWETHVVNVVPVNQVAPVIGGVPVEGLPGKYYLSVNSFGDIEKCEFSNKIFILDTVTDLMELMYEENSQTLAKDDPRACNSEMYLLATDQAKLILKYHTINTNMTCESSWSEPEKTWYIDVTQLESKTRRYVISNALYTQAEDEEAICRSALNATTP